MTEPTADEIAEEQKRLRRLRALVDLTVATLYQADITVEEAVGLVVECRRSALSLFPGREETFDLLYHPRLLRVVRERFGECLPERLL